MNTWNEILNEQALAEFAARMGRFHDGCVKELRYVSGAYVAENLNMYPLNDRRMLRMVIQCQSREHPVVELEFAGLKTLSVLCLCVMMETDSVCHLHQWPFACHGW